MLFFVFLSLLAMFDLLVGALRLRAVPVSRSRSVALAEVNSVRRLRDQTFLSDCPGESLLGIEREALAAGHLRVLIPPLRRAPPVCLIRSLNFMGRTMAGVCGVINLAWPSVPE